MLSAVLADLLATHRALGAEARALAATATGGGRVPPRRARALVRVLVAHQHAEEVAVFPALAHAAPGFDPTGLIDDHVEVAGAARALHAAVRRRGGSGDPAAAAVRLARLVRLHLDDEQRTVVPRGAVLSAAEGDAVGRALRHALGPVGRARVARLTRRHPPAR